MLLFQVKNDTNFGEGTHGYLLDGMNPFTIELYDEKNKLLQKFQMVLSLAPRTYAEKYDTPDQPSKRTYTPGGFTRSPLKTCGVQGLLVNHPQSRALTKMNIENCWIAFGFEAKNMPWAAGAIQEVKYPDGVEKKKITLLRKLQSPSCVSMD